MSFFCILAMLVAPIPEEVEEIETKKEKRFHHPKLVDVKMFAEGIEVDLKYATADNFTGEVVYDFQNCLVCEEVAEKLGKVQAELEELGLGLKVWDGFRPLAVQWKFWELVPDERYVSNPLKGGRHTRGTAVDVTLVTQEGKELLMPSAFDDFSQRAHREYQGASKEALANRKLLQDVMEKHGFVGFIEEWWHFDLASWESFLPVEL